MTTLLDYILDLFRSPAVAANFVQDSDGALRAAGLGNVSASQFAAVAASAAPAGVLLGGGDPIQGLQHAVANYHSIPAAFSPQTAFAPRTDFASNNDTQLASNNDTSLFSPDQNAGSNAQQGAFNLGFGDITLGDKTTNTATDGAVVNTGTAGSIDTTSVRGNGNVVGEGNSANTGYIDGGSHSPIIIGEGNDTKVTDTSQHAGGDIITGNEGTVIKDNDMSGGHGGSAGASGGSSGGGLLGVGIGNGGNESTAGSGGSGGSIIINDTSSHSTSSTVGGNQTTAGGDLGSGNHYDSSVNTNVETETESHTANTVDDHSFTSNVASNNDTDIASHNDTSLASHNDTQLDAF